MSASHSAPERTRSGRLAAAMGAAALVVVLAGCTASPPAPPPPSASTTASAAPTSSAPAGGDELAAARAQGPLGPVDVIVRSLTLDDNGTTMTLRMAFTPHFEYLPGQDMSLAAMNNFTTLKPVLLDRENLKRYQVPYGGGQDYFMNQDAQTHIAEPLEMWFVFAAPEDDIDAIAVTIDEWLLEFPDIPITPSS